MKAIVAILGVLVILFLFGSMMTGIESAQTDTRTDSFTGITTGVGETTADVELVADIFSNNLNSVTSITSDDSTDAPLPDAWDEPTNTLTVRGLASSTTRALTVTYKYNNLNGNAEAIGSFLDIMPMLVAVAAIFILIVAGFAGYQWMKGRGG